MPVKKKSKVSSKKTAKKLVKKTLIKPKPALPKLPKPKPKEYGSIRIKTSREEIDKTILVDAHDFMNLSQIQKEKIINSLFSAKYKGFRSMSGVEMKFPQGYSVRFASLLTAEQSEEVVKRIFVVLEEYNDFITSMDIDSISSYLHDLEKTNWYKPTRDDVWVVTNQKWTFEAYAHASEKQTGHIYLMDMDTFLEGIQKYYNKSRDLRNKVRSAGLVK